MVSLPARYRRDVQHAYLVLLHPFRALLHADRAGHGQCKPLIPPRLYSAAQHPFHAVQANARERRNGFMNMRGFIDHKEYRRALIR